MMMGFGSVGDYCWMRWWRCPGLGVEMLGLGLELVGFKM